MPATETKGKNYAVYVKPQSEVRLVALYKSILLKNHQMYILGDVAIKINKKRSYKLQEWHNLNS